MEYKKSQDGNHFYRVSSTEILHVFHIKNDAIITQENKDLTTITEFKKDDCCINIVHGIRDNVIDCSKEEFEGKIREVIFILGIYEFTEKID